MGFVTTIGGLPITGPLFGLEWLARRIAEAAERELNDPTRVERELITLERALDAGEIDEATFEAREAELLTELAEIMHARARPGEATPLSDPDTDMAQETGAATLPPDGTDAAA
jgi:hypothetical protein